MNINRDYITKINFTDKNSTARIKYIVIHYFGGLATAEKLAKYWARSYAGASAHYAVGHNGKVYQCVEDCDIAWHCGGVKSYKHPLCRNTNSIGIEMAVKKKNTKTQRATDKDWYFTPETVASTVELTRQLMEKYHIPAENVIRHYDVTGKICPNPYYYNTGTYTWQAFKQAISTQDSTAGQTLTPILGQAQAGAEQIAAYIVNKNPNTASYVAELASCYIEEGNAEGVRGDVAAAQSIVETGNFTFAGSAVTLEQNNFCGMGVTQRGMKGNSFATMREGVRAQIQHLKAYATTEPLNNPFKLLISLYLLPSPSCFAAIIQRLSPFLTVYSLTALAGCLSAFVLMISDNTRMIFSPYPAPVAHPFPFGFSCCPKCSTYCAHPFVTYL